MSTINEFRSRIKANSILDAARESLEAQEALIARTQRQQLKTGLTGGVNAGRLIGQYKNKSYARKKFAQNSEAGYGNVDLTLTGDYANAIFIDVLASTIVIGSTDSKADILGKKYGEPLGLNRPSRIFIIENGLRSTFVNTYKRKLQV